MFQSFNLIPTLTAAENVEAAMVPVQHTRAARRSRVELLLERVGLANRAAHLPSTLSGGEQQRVAIARALANEPRVILADEPTGNLDSATAEEVVEVLRELSSENTVTVIVVTHAEEVARHAERRVRLRDGSVVRRVASSPSASSSSFATVFQLRTVVGIFNCRSTYAGSLLRPMPLGRCR